MKKSSIAEFEKLYNVNIPVAPEFNYYKNLLLKSAEFNYLPEALIRFEDFEKTLGPDDTIKSKKLKAMDRLVDYISGTNTYSRFINYDLNKLPRFNSLDKRNYCFIAENEFNYFVSIDIVSANYSTMQYFFDKSNELCYDWRELCMVQDVPLVFSQSKSFRQYVFGNLNPKRNQTIQQSVITGFVDKIQEEFGQDIIYITHDEIMLKFSDSTPIMSVESKLNEILKSGLPLKYTFFKIDHVENKSKIIVKNILGRDGKVIYKTLFGVPGNQFYYYYKKYIIKEKIEIRDLYFWNDNKLAIWVMNPEHQQIDSEIINQAIEQSNF